MSNFPFIAFFTAGSPTQDFRSWGWQARITVFAACTARELLPWTMMTGGEGWNSSNSFRSRRADSIVRTQAIKRVGFCMSSWVHPSSEPLILFWSANDFDG